MVKNPVSVCNGVQLSRLITEAPKASGGERGRNMLKVSGWLCIMLTHCLRATRMVWVVRDMGFCSVSGMFEFFLRDISKGSHQS